MSEGFSPTQTQLTLGKIVIKIKQVCSKIMGAIEENARIQGNVFILAYLSHRI